jgi:hypothetical protein
VFSKVLTDHHGLDLVGSGSSNHLGYLIVLLDLERSIRNKHSSHRPLLQKTPVLSKWQQVAEEVLKHG